jgi:hypothetical protein
VDEFGFVAQEIGSFTLAGTKFLLAPGSDTAGLLVGISVDVRVREVAL